MDVTQKLAEMVRNNTLTIEATNDVFGMDPAENIAKQLRVDFTYDGVAYFRIARENTTLHITRPGAQRLAIKKALYGDLPNGVCVEVTTIVAQLVENDQLSVNASNDLFGDPAVGIEKTLHVEYLLDNQPRSKEAHENDTLVLSPALE